MLGRLKRAGRQASKTGYIKVDSANNILRQWKPDFLMSEESTNGKGGSYR